MTAPAAPPGAGLTAGERRAVFSLGGIYALRMLGLFLILPVFSLYIDDLRGATPALMGIALGIYGLTQGLLQIPFGLLSDRIGRKPVIIMGLLLFALGSVVAALSDNIWGIIIGRAVQGSGAVAAAIMALTADLTREEQRTKAMAMIGMSIGSSFLLALALGPLLDAWVGLRGLFWITAILAAVGIAVLIFLVPNPVTSRVRRDAEPVPAQFGRILRDAQLLRLDLGIFLLHCLLTACFVAFPLVLEQRLHLPSVQHGWVYVPILLLSVAAMVPFIIQAEKHRRMKPLFLGAIATLAVVLFVFPAVTRQFWLFAMGLFIFFTAFNFLEASLPSLVSKMAPADSKGTAMGFYSSSQFLGVSLGGSAAGVLLTHFAVESIFVLAGGCALLWLMLAASMRSPRYLASHLLQVGRMDSAAARRLAASLTGVRGVAEAVVIAEDGVAYLKVDKHALDEQALAAVVEKSAV